MKHTKDVIEATIVVEAITNKYLEKDVEGNFTELSLASVAQLIKDGDFEAELITAWITESKPVLYIREKK